MRSFVGSLRSRLGLRTHWREAQEARDCFNTGEMARKQAIALQMFYLQHLSVEGRFASALLLGSLLPKFWFLR
jgi:hypothetical protein